MVIKNKYWTRSWRNGNGDGFQLPVAHPFPFIRFDTLDAYMFPIYTNKTKTISMAWMYS